MATNSKMSACIIHENLFFPEFHSPKLEAHAIHEHGSGTNNYGIHCRNMNS